MNAFLLISTITTLTLQNVIMKAYSKRGRGGSFSFASIGALAALIVFIIASGGKLNFNAAIIPHSIAFAVSYCTALVGTFLAVREGPLSLTSLITSYSLIVPTLYGLIFGGEDISVLLIIGLALLLISLVFINLKSKNDEKKISAKWVFYVLLAFVGNGMCSTVQRIQQENGCAVYKNEFMIIALLISAVAIFICALLTERKSTFANLKDAAPYAASRGIANGLTNLFVLLLTPRMPASVMFPLISAGGIVATVLISIFVYKEKLSLQEKIGVIIGIAAIVVLNI
ncbi:MAG: EamA family transporter [Clostridia bacterium]|nr:EamA family transporter [Clostridia bacterium]